MEFDFATQTHLELLYPFFSMQVRLVIERVFTLCEMSMRVTEGLRSFSRQAQLFQQGRTIPGPDAGPGNMLGKTVTDAVAGLSIHHYGVAADLCFKGGDPYLSNCADSKKLWAAFGRIAEQVGLGWGGRFTRVDSPHLELTFGIRVQDMRDIYENGGMSALWTQFDKIRGVPTGTDWGGRRLVDPNR